MTKYAIVLPIFVLFISAAVCQGGLYLEIVDVELLFADGGDSEIITLRVPQDGFNNSIRGGRIGGFHETTVVDLLDIQHIWDFGAVTPSIDTIYTYPYTINNLFPPQTLELTPLITRNEPLYFDGVVTKWDRSDLHDLIVITAIPEPASLVMLGIGGLLIRKRNK